MDACLFVVVVVMKSERDRGNYSKTEWWSEMSTLNEVPHRFGYFLFTNRDICTASTTGIGTGFALSPENKTGLLGTTGVLYHTSYST